MIKGKEVYLMWPFKWVLLTQSRLVTGYSLHNLYGLVINYPFHSGMVWFPTLFSPWYVLQSASFLPFKCPKVLCKWGTFILILYRWTKLLLLVGIILTIRRVVHYMPKEKFSSCWGVLLLLRSSLDCIEYLDRSVFLSLTNGPIIALSFQVLVRGCCLCAYLFWT